MHITFKTRTKAKKSWTIASLPFMLKKRAQHQRIQAVRADLAACTLYMVDGDDIVITSLDRKPFCCQEELACMCRAELYRVARELNQKLPAACRIEPLSAMPAPVIRCKIEEVMGFRHFRPDLSTRSPKSSFSSANSRSSIEEVMGFRHFRPDLSTKLTRSPKSSFSSASSRSSTLYVVKELDEI